MLDDKEDMNVDLLRGSTPTELRLDDELRFYKRETPTVSLLFPNRYPEKVFVVFRQLC
jgi:hypothetical protein